MSPIKFCCFGLLLIIALVVLGCNPLGLDQPSTENGVVTQPDANSVAVAPATSIPTPTNVPTQPPPTDTPPPPTPTETPLPPPTETSTPAPPTDTPTPPPPTDTPTPAAPAVTVDVDLNVRSGPGTNYNRVGLLVSGTTVEVIGRTEDESWWQIVYPNAPDGVAWISAAYGEAVNTGGVPVAAIPPTPIPPAPTSTPVPAQPDPPPVDFVIVEQRLWTNEENGGWSPGGSVSNCGYGHEIHVEVIDAAGNPLDGIILKDTYNNPPQITGSKGPGRAQYLLYFNGYNIFVAEDGSAGRPVTSETSATLSAKEVEIPIPWLIAAHYCANEEECQLRVSQNALCQGHYSWTLKFQRVW